MAHMKMNFYPMLFLGLYLSASRLDIKEFGAPILGGLAVMPMVIAAFFAYWVFVRHELLPLDIVIYMASMIGAVHLAKKWRENRMVRRFWPVWLVVAVLVIVLSGYLTYHAPDWLIFTQI